MSKFSNTAMLVSLNVSTYGARRHDRAISDEVAKQHNASQDAGRYNKMLVAKEFLDPITKAVGELRGFFRDQSLPWMNDGIRIMPALNYQPAKAGFAEKIDKVDSAVRTFCGLWQSVIIPRARVDLNGMFRDSDYPVNIADRFGCTVRYFPLPDAQDFRVAMSDLERDTLRAEIEETIEQAANAAVGDIYRQMFEPVRHMADKLKAYKPGLGDQKAESTFRDSLVENVREICERAPRLNFAGDSRLDSFVAEISATLAGNSAEELRNDMIVRADVAKRAEDIANRLSEFMV